MKISIMITTYNLEKYIEKALDSVLNQKTEHEYEILIGDDGSTDNTVSIIRDYQRKYPNKILLFVMPRIQDKQYDKIARASQNRLNLWAHATGEYCSFLDGDDYYTDELRLDKMAAILDDPANKDCVMCAHNLELTYESGEESVPLVRAVKTHKFRIRDYWPLIFIQANALMFRNVYKDMVKDEYINDTFDDNLITFRLFKYGNMFYLPDIMGAYRQLQGSSWNERNVQKQMRVNLDELWLEKKIFPEAFEYSITRHYKELSYYAKHTDLIDADEYADILSIYPDSVKSYFLAKLKRALMKLIRMY